MRIRLNSVPVADQAHAEDFYTRVLGFRTKHDIPVGEFRWLTVVSADEPDGAELLLEPNEHPAAKQYQAALHADGIPVTSFEVDDVAATHRRLADAGVTFTAAPTDMGDAIIAVFDDTCGNLIQIYEASHE
jgi:catechol 2,3-dioxygenase-like lactoylglutathione lyase family enzyme